MHTEPNQSTPVRRSRSSLAALLLPIGVAAAAVGAKAPQDGTLPVLEARTTIQEWRATRALISQERVQWAFDEQMLTDEIELVEEAIAMLREEITTASADISEADAKVEELVAERDLLEASSAGLASAVEGLEARVRELLVRLPEPLLEKLQLLIQQMPEEDGATELSTAQRYRNVIGILNQVNKFNREITYSSQVQKLPDGSEALVDAIYLGIGQGYYVTADGQSAGVGRSTREGWSWTARNDAAPQIAEALEVYRIEKPAVFVQLPVTID